MKKNLLTSTCKASNVFQKAFRLPQTALSYFLLAIIFLSSTIKVKAQATPDASFTITSSTPSAYFTSYPHSTVSTDAGISSSSGDFFVSESSTPSGPGASYIDVTATSGYVIDSIVYSLTGNGSNKTLQPAVLGWVSGYNATTADYSFTGVTATVANKGLANATPFSYDLSGKNITEARIFRAIKSINVVSPPLTASTTAIGNAATLQFYGIKVYVSPIIILPVTFINITAQETNGTITVSWKTASQINITKYEVEQSTDGIAYSKIGTINADANKSNYSLSGINATTTVHYRIKAIGSNGAVTYSNIANLTVNASNASSIEVYPNPVTGHAISIRFNNLSSGKYVANLINYNGQQIKTASLNYDGNGIQSIHIPQTAPGMYQLKVLAPNNTVYKTTVLIK